MEPNRQQRIRAAISAALEKPRPKTLLKLSSPLPWGKYKGECARTICQVDPQYMQWFLNETTIAVDPPLRQHLNTQLELAR